jgi:hypothetical protein
LLAALVSLTTGCKALFPTEDKQTKSQWQSFDEAQLAFERILPHQTTLEDLKELGFDPVSSPNVRLLTYLDLIEKFMPNISITKEDLPKDVRECIEAKDCCRAYELDLDVSHSKRYGNIAADMFGFNKKTRITGWNFNALVVIRNDLVIYKIRSGQPQVNRLEKKTKPLGPLQELDNIVGKFIPGL